MDEIIQAYLASGGAVTRCATGAGLGITNDEWKRLVRGEGEPVEVPALIEAFVERQAKKPLRLRVGYGEVR